MPETYNLLPFYLVYGSYFPDYSSGAYIVAPVSVTGTITLRNLTVIFSAPLAQVTDPYITNYALTFTIYAGSSIGAASQTALTVTIDGTNTSAANNTNIVTLNQFSVFALQASQAVASTPFGNPMYPNGGSRPWIIASVEIFIDDNCCARDGCQRRFFF